MDFHRLAQRQLRNQNLTFETLPPDLLAWQQFLMRVNQTYLESDQERYLLERSMIISSRELQELNEKLERAQHIAKLGYWHVDLVNDFTSWTNELYTMLGYSKDDHLPSLNELIHDDYRISIEKFMNNAIKNGEGFSEEVKIKDKAGHYRWVHLIAAPHFDTEQDRVTEIFGTLMDISARKQIQVENEILHTQLLSSARRAGMSEVTTSILHNVGNVLNSVNISLTMIKENLTQPHFKKLVAILAMLDEHKNEMEKFLSTDSKGKLIPEYLAGLINMIAASHEKVLEEWRNLFDHIGHIKDITSMQNAIGMVSGIYEKISTADVVDMAIKMCGGESATIKIKKLSNDITPFIVTDKSKLLQILINLIQNAKDACPIDGSGELHIYLRGRKDGIDFEVKDNGLGVAPENLTKIFSFGFTTKLTGHGYGLHSCALSAKELGGKISATNDALNHGAVFILSLPLQAPDRKVAHD